LLAVIFRLGYRKTNVSMAEAKSLTVFFRYYSVISGGSIKIVAAENA
jgi:hypothetical protein